MLSAPKESTLCIVFTKSCHGVAINLSIVRALPKQACTRVMMTNTAVSYKKKQKKKLKA